MMTNVQKIKGFLASGCFLIALQVHAEPNLSLADAIELATQSQPLLQSLDDAANANRQAAIAESQLPDPKLKFGVINLPVTTRNALSFSRDDQTMVNIGYSQEMVPLKKRELASDRLTAMADEFHSEQIATSRAIERDVALAWLDVYEAQRRSELYQRIIAEMTAERHVLAASVSSGGVKTSDVLRMDTEISMTNEKYILAVRDEQKARALLARWIGQAAGRPIASELPVMTNNFSTKNTAAEIEKHPLILNAYQIEKVAQFDVESAKANLQHNWGWEVGYGKRFADRSDMLSFQVSIDLQLDKANRQDRRTAEKLVLVQKAQKLIEDKRRELLAYLDSALADAQSADAREKIHLNNLIPNANARLAIAQAGYSAGKNPLLDVWDARRGIIEIELDHWIILTDKQRAAVKIGYLLNDTRLFKPN